MMAESTKAKVRSRRPAGMEVGSGCRERTHKDKAFCFRQIGHLQQQRTHSEYHLCYQLVAAISRPISANFEWIASTRLQNCELSMVREGPRMPTAVCPQRLVSRGVKWASAGGFYEQS
jgi:hypothetical protein